MFSINFQIKMAVKYKIDGKELAGFPGQDLKNTQIIITNLMIVFACSSTFGRLEKVEVEYVTLPGWKSSIKQMRSYDRRVCEGSYEVDWCWTS